MTKMQPSRTEGCFLSSLYINKARNRHPVREKAVDRAAIFCYNKTDYKVCFRKEDDS